MEKTLEPVGTIAVTAIHGNVVEIIHKESIYPENSTRVHESTYRDCMAWGKGRGQDVHLVIEIQVSDVALIYKGKLNASLLKVRDYVTSLLVI